ncbi:extensin family protein [Hyphomicrobium sp. B1]|uniref:extensin-like domain-containing protein n=1 Tax=Hyphomicrobium sp. B1 TaxID=3075651 RepID=UPI003C2C8407
MSRQQELLALALAFRSKAAVKADELAVRSSVLLTRIVFFGLLLLPFFEPNSFSIVRAGRLSSPPALELHARVDVPPIIPSSPKAPTLQADSPPADKKADAAPTDKAADAAGPNLPASSNAGQTVPTLPAQSEASAKPVPPGKQSAPEWTEAEIASAKQDCTRLLGKITVVSEELPPVREGICGAPAPYLLKAVGESKVRIEPAATLNCQMIAGLNSWVTDKLEPAAKKTFGSSIVRVIAGSYSCRNRYGLARAPISEHALMNAIDVSAFVLADGKVIRISKDWGPTEEELKRAQKASDAAAPAEKAKFQVAASKLGAHDIAKKSDEKDKSDAKSKADPKAKAKSPEELKAEQEKQAVSAFLHQAHDGACDIFDTVLGPDTNEAHRDHLHLDMKERKRHLTLCE